MKNTRPWAVTAISMLLATAGVGHAAPLAASSAGHGAAAPPEKRAAEDLAHAILARMPATTAPGGACAPPTLDSLRAAVTAAIGQTNPSREVALAALDVARRQAPASAACVLIALDDTADELDGSGATVDDAGKVRGFSLYTGPLPPTLRRVSNP